MLCTSDPGTDAFTDSGDHEAEGAHPPPPCLPTALTLEVTTERSGTDSYGDSSFLADRNWNHALFKRTNSFDTPRSASYWTVIRFKAISLHRTLSSMSYILRFPEASVHKGVFGERQELRMYEVTKTFHSPVSVTSVSVTWKIGRTATEVALVQASRDGGEVGPLPLSKLDVELYKKDSRIIIEMISPLFILLSWPRFPDGSRSIERQISSMSVFFLAV